MSLIAAGTGVTFGLALVLLATFFRTRNERFDRVAEWLFVVFSIVGVMTILAVRDRMGTALDATVGTALTILGAGGVAILGLAELASALKLVDFRRIAALTTLGFVAFLIWIGGISVAIATGGGTPFPTALGWLGIGSIVVGLGVIGWIMRTPGVLTGSTEPDPSAMTLFFVPMAGIVAWFVWLGLSL